MIKNKWKAAFFLLLAVMIAVIIFVVFLLFSPANQEPLPTAEHDLKEHVAFQVSSNKADLNKIINYYLEKEGLNGPIEYNVYLNDESVVLQGKMKVFTQMIDMEMTFEPEALENGDLVLHQKSISVGKLKLPVSYILKFIRDSYQLPSWVNIQPDEQLVYVSLQDMELKGDMKVRADEFNLKEDDIQFTLMVLTES